MSASYSTSIKPTYNRMYSATLSGASSVTFSDIPQNYTDLVVVFSCKSNTSGSSVNLMRFQFNGDTSSTYSDTILYGSSGGAAGSRDTGQSELYAGVVPQTSVTDRGTSVVNIQNYSNGSTYKTIVAKAGTAEASYVNVSSGLWRSTAAISSIKMYMSGATLTGTINIYGIECAKAPKADGGTVYTDGAYWYHVFRTSGTFTPKVASLTADVLVTAGGGGGGYGGAGCGGGGAGGLLYFASQSLSATSHACIVGSGGAGGTSTNGVQGSNSQFGALTASVGGGYGGGSYQATGVVGGDGGSGGGAGAGNTNLNWGQAGGSPTSGQGYAGGVSQPSEGGGGGGAGEAPGTSRDGGDGVNTYSSWASATGTGASGYYAGGGGGSKYPSGVGTGGAGGGGNSGQYSVNGAIGQAGAANTGGGGGGGGYANNNPGHQYGGTGGSGLIIVRYAV